MESKLFDTLWNDFIEKEFKTFQKGKRAYVHFDNRIGFDELTINNKEIFILKFNERFKNDFESSINLFKTGFYPFIKVTKSVLRYKFDKERGRRVTTKKSRPLCYASHFDALRYSWYSTILTHCYENYLKTESFNNSILAYRKLEGKPSNIDFAFKAFKEIEKRKECVVIALDISKFFDKINHQILYHNWIKVLKVLYPDIKNMPEDHYNIFKNITKFQFVNKEILDEIFADYTLFDKTRTRICSPKEYREFVRGVKLIETNEYYKKDKIKDGGIPQGSPISSVLANISMLDFDKNVFDFINNIGGVYYRYSDDLLIIIDQNNVEEVRKKLDVFIQEIYLEFNDKTEIIYFRKQGDKIISVNESGNLKKLQYLGFEYDGERIFIRSSSLSKYHAAMKKNIKRAVAIAFGKHGKGTKVYKSKLLRRFTQSGENNFIYYARRAGEIKLDLKSIQRQYVKQYKHLNKSIERKSQRRKKD